MNIRLFSLDETESLKCGDIFGREVIAELWIVISLMLALSSNMYDIRLYILYYGTKITAV